MNQIVGNGRTKANFFIADCMTSRSNEQKLLNVAFSGGRDGV